jgi:hypothetical protein
LALQDLPAESECPERKSTGPIAGTIKKLNLYWLLKLEIAEKIPLSRQIEKNPSKYLEGFFCE